MGAVAPKGKEKSTVLSRIKTCLNCDGGYVKISAKTAQLNMNCSFMGKIRAQNACKLIFWLTLLIVKQDQLKVTGNVFAKREGLLLRAAYPLTRRTEMVCGRVSRGRNLAISYK